MAARVVVCLALLVALASCQSDEFERKANEYEVESQENVAKEEPVREKVVFSIDEHDKTLKANLPKANLVVGVISSPAHFEQRQAVRTTWAQLQSLTDPKLNNLNLEEKEQMVVRFIIGDTDEQMDKLLAKESLKYRDIVRVPVKEDYFNLTRKTGEFLRWASSSFDLDYAVKCDDDSFVRIDKLLEDLKTREKTRLYMGKVWSGTPVDRRIDDYTPWKEYAPFAAGAGYVLSADLVSYIVRNLDSLHMWPLEDVAVGMWLSPLDVKAVDHGRFHSLPEGCDKDMIVQNPANATVMRETFFNTVKGVPCHAYPDPFRPSTKNVPDHVLLELGIPKAKQPVVAGMGGMMDALTPQLLQQDEDVAMEPEDAVETRFAGAEGMSADVMNANHASSMLVTDMNKHSGEMADDSLTQASEAAEGRMNM